MYKKGDRVNIVSCDLFPEFVGKVGTIELVLNVCGEAKTIQLYRVNCEGKTIPHYATEDCLELVE